MTIAVSLIAMSGAPPTRIPLRDALDTYFRRLALPAEQRDRLLKLPRAAGLVWLSDEPLLAYDENGLLVVERATFAALLAKAKPLG